MEEVNTFLRANRILSVDRHFVQDGGNSVWAICVSYLCDETGLEMSLLLFAYFAVRAYHAVP